MFVRVDEVQIDFWRVHLDVEYFLAEACPERIYDLPTLNLDNRKINRNLSNNQHLSFVDVYNVSSVTFGVPPMLQEKTVRHDSQYETTGTLSLCTRKA